MRKKVAKKLRQEAKAIAQANNFPYAEYEFTQYRKVTVKLDGTPVQYMVYTMSLINDSERKLYKQLKRIQSSNA